MTASAESAGCRKPRLHASGGCLPVKAAAPTQGWAQVRGRLSVRTPLRRSTLGRDRRRRAILQTARALGLQPRTSCPGPRATNVRGAMPIPPYEGRRTYFFFADVEPKELMTFGVEAGIPLDDDSMLEVLGHALAYWAIAEEQDVLTLRAFVQDVFDVTLAISALIRLDRGDRRDARSPPRHSRHRHGGCRADAALRRRLSRRRGGARDLAGRAHRARHARGHSGKACDRVDRAHRHHPGWSGIGGAGLPRKRALRPVLSPSLSGRGEAVRVRGTVP